MDDGILLLRLAQAAALLAATSGVLLAVARMF